MIKILSFASIRERLGASEEQIPLPDGMRTSASLLAWLRARGGVWAEVLGEGEPIPTAVDQEVAHADTPIGEEVAIFPPVTGG